LHRKDKVINFIENGNSQFLFLTAFEERRMHIFIFPGIPAAGPSCWFYGRAEQKATLHLDKPRRGNPRCSVASEQTTLWKYKCTVANTLKECCEKHYFKIVIISVLKISYVLSCYPFRRRILPAVCR
jgi:hypothetical protein